MVTDSALMIQVDGTDTMYVHADTLRSIQNPDPGRAEPHPESILQSKDISSGYPGNV